MQIGWQFERGDVVVRYRYVDRIFDFRFVIIVVRLALEIDDAATVRSRKI
jgi:hypothetical protein